MPISHHRPRLLRQPKQIPTLAGAQWAQAVGAAEALAVPPDVRGPRILSQRLPLLAGAVPEGAEPPAQLMACTRCNF